MACSVTLATVYDMFSNLTTVYDMFSNLTTVYDMFSNLTTVYDMFSNLNDSDIVGLHVLMTLYHRYII